MKKISIILALVMIMSAISSVFTVSAAENGVSFTVSDNLTMSEIVDTPQTWEFTIKADKNAPDRPGAIICNYRIGNTDSNGIDLRGGGKITLWWGSAGGKNEERLTFNYDVRTGEKLKFAIVSDIKGKTATLYVNGKAVETKKNLILADLSPTDTYMIGGDYRYGASLGDNAQWLKQVEIYDFALYSDIRTESEIKKDVEGYDYTDKDMLCAYDLTKDVNGRLTDLSGNKNNLVPHGALADGYIAPMELGNALVFSEDDFYSVKAPSDFPSTAEFSISNGDSASGKLFEASNYSLSAQNGKFTLTLGGKNYAFDKIKPGRGDTSLALIVEKGKATLYCDESSQTVSDGSIDKTALSGDVVIGKGFTGSGIYSAAFYSDVRTADEIKTDFLSPDKTDKNMISCYNFTKSVSVRTHDFSGNGNTLTPNGSFDHEKKQAEILDDFKPVLRFMVTSDIHITPGAKDRIDRTKKAIAAAYKVSETSEEYKTLDLAAFAGDIADDGYQASWETVRKLFDEAFDYDETQLLSVMGNHDYYSGSSTAPASEQPEKLPTYDSVFGKSTTSTPTTKILSGDGSGNVHYVVNGFHFIGFSSDQNGWTYSSKVASWLDEQLSVAQKDTGSDKPIFIFTHIGNVNTVFGTGTKSVYGVPGVSTYEKVLEKYPNAVIFSGHSHKPINDECSVYQKDYTALSTGTLNYHIVSSDGNALIPFSGGSTTDGNPGQFYIVEADAEGRVLVRIYDLNKDAFLDRYYIFDSYDPDNFVYTPDRLETKDILFDKGSEIKITDVQETSVSYSFPVSSKDSFAARDFRVDIADSSSGEVVSTSYYAWKYYNEDYSTVIKGKTSGLKPGKDYIIRVYGVNSGFLENIDETAVVSSVPLESGFKTTGEAGMEIEHAPVSVKGEGIDFTASDYYLIKDITKYAQTFEFQIKVEEGAKSRLGGICMNYKDGSTDSNGVDIRAGGQLLLWWSKKGAAADKRISFSKFNCASGEVIDVAIVGDVANGEARLYVNGELVQAIAADLYDLEFTDSYFIGGDYRKDGGFNSQYLKQSVLYNLTLYSDVRTEEEIEADRKGADVNDENLIAAFDFTKPLEKRYHDLSGGGNVLVGYGKYAYEGPDVYEITDISVNNGKVTVSTDGSGADVTSVKVDGETVAYATVKNGIEMDETLFEAGEHTVEITIGDSEISGKFTVSNTSSDESNSENTGEESTAKPSDERRGLVLPFIAGGAAALAALAAAVFVIKKKG